jgi:hypothetical protein
MGKYDITGALTPVQSTFVDPGLATFKEAATLHRANYDKNKDAYNLTKRIVNQLQLMPGDEDSGLRDEFTSTIDQSFEQIISSGAYEDADMAVQNAVSFITSDKTVLRAQQNAAEYLKEEALIDQYGPSGVLDFNRNARETFTTKGADKNGQPILNSYRENMEMKEGYAAFMKNLVSGIAESGSPWISDKYGISEDQLGQYLTYGNTVGVSKSKMERVVNGLYETYIEDKVGDQDFRRLTKIQGLSPSEAKADILNRMKGIARPQVGMKTTLSGLKDNAPTNEMSALTLDPYTKAILNKGPQRVDITSFKALSGLEDGTAANSVAISGQKGMIMDFASQMSESTKSKIAVALVDGKLANDVNEASSMVGPLLNFLVAEEAGKTDLANTIAGTLGFDYNDRKSKEIIQAVSQQLKAIVDVETLQNMGGLLKVDNLTGSFKPNTGSGHNMEVIGGDLIVDGRYWFTEQEMENIASQMGKDEGTGGWLFGWDLFGDNLENITDASGNKIFQEEGEIDDVKYWSMTGKSVVPYSGTAGNKWFTETHGQKIFDELEVPINNARETAYSMDATQENTVSLILSDLASVPISQALKNDVKDLGQAYLQVVMQKIADGGRVSTASGAQNAQQLYSQISKQLRIVINTASNTPGADRDFVDKKIQEYLMPIFYPQAQ